MAWDADGNVVVTGYVNGTVDFGGGLLDATGGQTVVAKLGPKGEHVWSKVLGETSGRGVAVDKAGNAIVVGTMSGLHVVKLDSLGKQLWSKSFVSSGSALDYASPAAVAVDGDGAIVVVGGFAGTADFGGGAVTDQGNGDIFVVKLTADGAHVWDKQYGDSAGQGALGVALDPTGSVVLVGSMAGVVDFGGGPVQSAGGSDVFVAKLDAGGAHVWSKAFGDADEQYAQGVAVDHDGGIVTAGIFAGKLELNDAGGRTSAGGVDGFVAKLDANGSYRWMKSFGDAADQDARGVAVDALDNVVVTGAFEGTIDLGGGPISAMGGAATYLGKFDANGQYLWSKGFLDAIGGAVAASASRRLAITGTVIATTDFGTGPLMPVGGLNFFVAAFEP